MSDPFAPPRTRLASQRSPRHRRTPALGIWVSLLVGLALSAAGGAIFQGTQPILDGGFATARFLLMVEGPGGMLVLLSLLGLFFRSALDVGYRGWFLVCISVSLIGPLASLAAGTIAREHGIASGVVVGLATLLIGAAGVHIYARGGMR